MLLISDPNVLRVLIQESGEELVDLRTVKELFCDKRKASVSRSSLSVRISVAEKLITAQQNLPNGARLLIIEGHRPLTLQKEYFEEYSNELKGLHPEWNSDKVYQEASKYVAPPETVPPHSTGGAIDVTLASSTGAEFDLGTRVNADPGESNNACFTDASNISAEAKSNREVLMHTMLSAGFVNYPCEWWHWSYGDRYWAYVSEKKMAIYNSIHE